MLDPYPESPSFRETPGTRDPEDEDEEDHGRTIVFDLYTAGHGFRVTATAKPRTVWHCKYCGDPMLNPAGVWWCRFDGPVTERPTVADGRLCECSWCLWNLDVTPKGGPHRQQCGSPGCQRHYDREQKAAKREELQGLDRLRAVAVIRQDPSRPNKDVAEELGIRPIRVKEARSLVTA